MGFMRTILCLTDYTPSSKIALGLTLRFAARLDCRIIFAHVESIDCFEFYEESKSKLSKFSAENKKIQTGKSDNLIQHELVYGNIVEQCELLAEKCAPSLLIIGKRKKKILEGIFWGESTQKIIDLVNSPVIIIPEEANEAPLTPVYYATDFSSGSISTLDILLPWCSILGVNLRLLHVSETDEMEYKAIAKMKQILHSFAEDREEVGMDFKILNGEPFAVILDFLSEYPEVMLAVTFHVSSNNRGYKKSNVSF